MIRGLAHFAGALAFLFGMLAAGTLAGVTLFKVAGSLGAEGDVLRWLLIPISGAAVVACYYAGKLTHRHLSKVL